MVKYFSTKSLEKVKGKIQWQKKDAELNGELLGLSGSTLRSALQCASEIKYSFLQY